MYEDQRNAVVGEEMSEIWSKMYIGLHVKYPFFFSDFNGTLISSTIIENFQINKGAEKTNFLHTTRSAPVQLQ